MEETYSVYVNEISKGIGMISKARHCLNQNTLITMYYSFIHPYIKCCNHICGCSATSNFNKISTMQKEVIRIICKTKPPDPWELMYSALGVMKFPDINVYLICNFMFRVGKEDPEIFRTYFRFNSEIRGSMITRIFLLLKAILENRT